MKEFPVWISDVNTLPDALNMIRSVGEITGRKEKAFEIVREICSHFEHLQDTLNSKPKTRNSKPACAYFIWHNPWMIAGSKTFIHEMMQYCGLQNCFAHLLRYPQITLNQLQTVNCKLLLLYSEPFPFKEKHAAEIHESFPEAKIIFVDGEMFSWYGSRLLKAPDYFVQLQDKIMGFDY
jgi:ABC-type Fe3+-hydroxamate transport system substrate-binding protein